MKYFNDDSSQEKAVQRVEDYMVENGIQITPCAGGGLAIVIDGITHKMLRLGGYEEGVHIFPRSTEDEVIGFDKN